MRIIAGQSKGRLLESVQGKGTRPTSDRVKESLFSIIQPRLPGSIILDLFSGTGSLGLEALSRGSHRAVFVENDRQAAAVLKKNCVSLGYQEQSEIIYKDILKALTDLSKRDILFDIIFMDPPYQKGYEGPVLTGIDQGGILDKDGVILLEHDKHIFPPESVGTLKRFDQRKYGGTGISFYRKE